MGNRLDDTDRDLLTFRPDINYIEPDVQPGEITPVSEDLPQLEDVQEKRRKVMKLAHAADLLATFMQARADEKAQDMVIKLDPKADATVIQSMLRRFPGADPNRITYPQYRACKDSMREIGKQIARKANITPDQINEVREDAVNMLGGGTVRGGQENIETGTDDLELRTGTLDELLDNTIPGKKQGKRRSSGGVPGSSKPQASGAGLEIGGFGTDNAKTGGLRPELDTNMQIIEPLDLGEIQYSLICILVNYIWKNFILKAFDFKVLGKRISNFLPQRLCDEGTIEAPDLILLGAELPKFFTQKPPNLSDVAPEVD